MQYSRNFLLCVLAAVAAACLLVAIIGTRVINASTDRLLQSESSRLDAQRTDAESIAAVFQQHEDLLFNLARQPQPRSEWTVVLLDLKAALARFTASRRHHQELPLHTAKAQLCLAQLMILHGSYTEAVDTINQSIALASEHNDALLTGLAKNTAGCSFATLGDFTRALASFQESFQGLRQLENQQNAAAIALRNIGLVQRALGQGGIESVRSAIALIEQDPESDTVSLAGELVVDFRMTLCEMHWAEGRLTEAAILARETLDQLNRMLSEINDSSNEKRVVARNRYTKAIRFAERNQLALETELANSTRNRDSSRQTSNRWQWFPLFDFSTDLVSNDLSLQGTMASEFEHQSGLVIAWGMYDWTHDVVIQVVKQVHDRTQLVIIADNEESLEEAQVALAMEGVPLDGIRFGICDCETPWFRDDGPIVSKTSSGDIVWFDSKLTRSNTPGRMVADALPQMIRRNWKTRTADIAIHIEGGMILSNGLGLTIASSRLLELNRSFGFSDETVVKELRRVTGAKQLHFVEPMINEPTGHVDLFLAFTDPATLVIGGFDAPADPNAQHLERVAAELGQISVDNQPINVSRIPMPRGSGDAFPSYTNVIFANGVLLVPSYSGESKTVEEQVKATYKKLLPEWDLVFIDCTRLRNKGGALHCMVSNLGSTQYTPLLKKTN